MSTHVVADVIILFFLWLSNNKKKCNYVYAFLNNKINKK